jgi:hypothetical protein
VIGSAPVSWTSFNSQSIPEKELVLTAFVFGALIENGGVEGLALGNVFDVVCATGPLNSFGSKAWGSVNGDKESGHSLLPFPQSPSISSVSFHFLLFQPNHIETPTSVKSNTLYVPHHFDIHVWILHESLREGFYLKETVE